MRWKSEVKVECCIVKENELGSQVSSDEVSERRPMQRVLATGRLRCESGSEIKYFSKLLYQLNQSGLQSVIKAGLPHAAAQYFYNLKKCQRKLPLPEFCN